MAAPSVAEANRSQPAVAVRPRLPSFALLLTIFMAASADTLQLEKFLTLREGRSGRQ
jgi:hypothetical protein